MWGGVRKPAGRGPSLLGEAVPPEPCQRRGAAAKLGMPRCSIFLHVPTPSALNLRPNTPRAVLAHPNCQHKGPLSECPLVSLAASTCPFPLPRLSAPCKAAPAREQSGVPLQVDVVLDPLQRCVRGSQPWTLPQAGGCWAPRRKGRRRSPKRALQRASLSKRPPSLILRVDETRPKSPP